MHVQSGSGARKRTQPRHSAQDGAMTEQRTTVQNTTCISHRQQGRRCAHRLTQLPTECVAGETRERIMSIAWSLGAATMSQRLCRWQCQCTATELAHHICQTLRTQTRRRLSWDARAADADDVLGAWAWLWFASFKLLALIYGGAPLQTAVCGHAPGSLCVHPSVFPIELDTALEFRKTTSTRALVLT